MATTQTTVAAPILTGVWKWITHDGQELRDVGILCDGSLHNPNGYDEATVREAIHQASEQVHARRSQAAKQAAITRKRRKEARLYEIVNRISALCNDGRRRHCRICRKPLRDPQSIAFGIDGDCWQQVLAAISASRTDVAISA